MGIQSIIDNNNVGRRKTPRRLIELQVKSAK